MSHISKIELEINDLSALKRACVRLGFEFKENQKEYVWYGRVVNPEAHPVPEGLTENDLGKCDHAIHIPNVKYQVGVIRRGTKYLLVCDFWDSGLKAAVGENGNRLKQAYAIERTLAEAKRRSFRVQETRTQNGVRLFLYV